MLHSNVKITLPAFRKRAHSIKERHISLICRSYTSVYRISRLWTVGAHVSSSLMFVKILGSKGWRDGSAIKSTCGFAESGFLFSGPTWCSQLFIGSVPGNLLPFSVSHRYKTRGVVGHARTHLQTKKN